MAESLTYFTADLHFGHANIIKFCQRPWKTADEMDAGLIERWNEVVTEKDEVWILGDVAMGNWRKAVSCLVQLVGRKHLIIGNHDAALIRKGGFLDCFETVDNLRTIKVPDEDAPGKRRHVVLCHYPLAVWDRSHHGTYHLHGHCHASMMRPVYGRRLDVGVDAWDYAPVSYSRVSNLLSHRKPATPDHHYTPKER
ncbi:MAG: hypothetical protein WBG86_14520 [Polyangiales bacterium]